jgi:hypothetical protein
MIKKMTVLKYSFGRFYRVKREWTDEEKLQATSTRLSKARFPREVTDLVTLNLMCETVL